MFGAKVHKELPCKKISSAKFIQTENFGKIDCLVEIKIYILTKC